jgi:hypothetical protein
MKSPVFIFLVFSLTITSFGKTVSAQEPNVTMSFKTVTTGESYAPKHVMAVWVEDQSGFIKTRLVRANQRKQYLYTWISRSSQDQTDAVTGATLSSHQSHTVLWDLKDLNGNLVPDGEYKIRVEFTEKHAQGPLYSVSFIKGPDNQLLNMPNTENFTDIQIEYAAPVVNRMDEIFPDSEWKVYPNPSNAGFNIALPESFSNHAVVKIYSTDLKVIYDEGFSNANGSSIYIPGEVIPAGLYILEITVQGKRFTRNLIVL